MEHIFLKDLTVNGNMQGTYILQSCQNKVACNGNPYISGTLMDTSATTSFIMFDYDGAITAADTGKAVNVAGDVETYNGRQQVKLYHIELVESNRDLLVAGALMHDIGKIIEFDRSEQGLVTDYSKKGQLMGHAVIGSEIIDRVGRSEGADEEKIDALKHLVLSHHGKAELGAAMAPKCIEAELLSMIDNMDSRVEIYRESLEDIQPGSFGDYNKYLTKRIYKVA